MELLKREPNTKINWLFIALTSTIMAFSSTGLASSTPSSKTPDGASSTPRTCDASRNFQEAFEYLKSRGDLPFSDTQLIRASLQIAEGCDGASQRFKQIYELLDKSGFDQRKSFELAKKFAKLNDAQTKNFADFFKGFFLENKFDLDFESSYNVALELSAQLEKNWDAVRNDFNSFLNFCTNHKENEDILPIRECANWTLTTLKLNEIYPQGVYSSFQRINNYLKDRKGLQLPIKDRLNLVSEVLRYGPKAADSFINTIEWSLKKGAPNVPPQQSWRLALEVSKLALAQVDPKENQK